MQHCILNSPDLLNNATVYCIYLYRTITIEMTRSKYILGIRDGRAFVEPNFRSQSVPVDNGSALPAASRIVVCI